jgi:hypothetical protein
MDNFLVNWRKMCFLIINAEWSYNIMRMSELNICELCLKPTQPNIDLGHWCSPYDWRYDFSTLRMVTTDPLLFPLWRRSAEAATDLSEPAAWQGIFPGGVCQKDSKYIRSYWLFAQPRGAQQVSVAMPWTGK